LGEEIYMIRQFAYWSAVVILFVVSGCSRYETNISALKHSDVKKRQNAAFRLSTEDQVKEEYLQYLIDASYDKDPIVREYAVKTIGKMNPRLNGVTQAIKRGLRDPELNVRRAAAAIFSTLNPVPGEVLFTLAQVLGDKDPYLRKLAKSTFVDLGPIGVGALTRTCMGENDTLRYHAASTLGSIGCEAKRALPVLNDMLKSENDELRATAQKSINAIKYTYFCTSPTEAQKKTQ
jgi:HEAT repeat protein